jgi:hypothetical protein
LRSRAGSGAATSLLQTAGQAPKKPKAASKPTSHEARHGLGQSASRPCLPAATSCFFLASIIWS